MWNQTRAMVKPNMLVWLRCWNFCSLEDDAFQGGYPQKISKQNADVFCLVYFFSIGPWICGESIFGKWIFKGPTWRKWLWWMKIGSPVRVTSMRVRLGESPRVLATSPRGGHFQWFFQVSLAGWNILVVWGGRAVWQDYLVVVSKIWFSPWFLGIFGIQIWHTFSNGWGTTTNKHPKNDLGGGFKYFLFSPLFGETIQVDEHIFSNGW